MEDGDDLTSNRSLPLEGGEDDPALRPQRLANFFGQHHARDLLEMELAGCRLRGEYMDHVLLYGPPGLGKTTLAQIIARELGGGFHSATAPTIQRQGDLAAILVCLQPGDVLFIDEIHRLAPAIEEVLYGAMEDFKLVATAGDVASPRSIAIPLPRFTLVGATTRPGLLTRPLRDRFGVDLPLTLYAPEDLAVIVQRSARLLSMTLEEDVAMRVAIRSRGTPRIANRFLRRIRNYAAHAEADRINLPLAEAAFDFLGVDHRGLDKRDRKYLDCLRARYKGQPVGLNTLAAALNEDVNSVEDEIEPWLLLQGFVERTKSGRILGPTVLAEFETLGGGETPSRLI